MMKKMGNCKTAEEFHCVKLFLTLTFCIVSCHVPSLPFLCFLCLMCDYGTMVLGKKRYCGFILDRILCIWVIWNRKKSIPFDYTVRFLDTSDTR